MLFWIQRFWKKLPVSCQPVPSHSCHFLLPLPPEMTKFRNIKLPQLSKNIMWLHASVSLHRLYSWGLTGRLFSPWQISIYLLKCNLDLIFSKKSIRRCPNFILNIVYVTFTTVCGFMNMHLPHITHYDDLDSSLSQYPAEYRTHTGTAQ